MRCFLVNDLLDIVSGKALKCSSVCQTNNISIYADNIKKDDVYIAINSSKYSTSDGGLGLTNNEDSVYGLGGYQNGHCDIAKAVINGAAVVIIDDISYLEEKHDICYILVDDCLSAMKKIAAYQLKICNVNVIAISGSTGKTTTSQAIYDFLSTYAKVKRIHRIRNSVLAMCLEIIQYIDPSDDFIIIEMQIDAYGQLQQFCDIAPPDISILTNINYSHYSRFSSIKNILHEKLTIYRNLKVNGKFIVNIDNVELNNWVSEQTDDRIIKIGIENKCEVSVMNVSLSGDYDFISFDACIRGKIIPNLKMQSAGEGSLYGALFSLVIANIYDFPSEVIAAGINKIKLPIGRFNCFEGINKSTVIVDSYNANYVSMAQGIKYVSKLNKRKKILIIGSMLELEERTEQEHRKIGQLINQLSNFTYIITLGEAAMYIYFEVTNIPKERKYCTFTFEDIIEIIDKITIDKDTIIYLKGSGAMRMEILAPYLLAKRIF